MFGLSAGILSLVAQGPQGKYQAIALALLGLFAHDA